MKNRITLFDCVSESRDIAGKAVYDSRARSYMGRVVSINSNLYEVALNSGAVLTRTVLGDYYIEEDKKA